MSNFEEFIRAEMPLRQVLLYDQGDPRVNGYLATLGTYYLDVTDNYQRYEKTGPGDYDWVQVGAGNGETGAPRSLINAVTALSAEVFGYHVYPSLSSYSLTASGVSGGQISRIDNLETSVSELSAEMYSLSTYNMSGHQSRIDRLRTDVSELSADNHNLNTQLSMLNNSVTALSALNQDDDFKIAQLATSLSALQENFSNMQTGDVAIENRLAEMESSMGSIDFIEQSTLVLSTDVENLSATSVSCFDTRTFRTAKYVISVHSSQSYMSMEMLVTFHNNSKYGKGIKHVAYALLGDLQLVEHNTCLVGPYAILTFKPSVPGVTITMNRLLLTEQLPTIAYCGSTNLPVDRSDTIYITGPSGVTRTNVGSNGVTVQTLDGEGTIAVSNIELGGPPYHFRMLQGNTLVALITIPAKNEYELMRSYVYLKIGKKLWRGRPNPAADDLILIDQSIEAPTCEGFSSNEEMYDKIPVGWDDLLLVENQTPAISGSPVYTTSFATTLQTEQQQFALAVTGITIGGLPKHYKLILPGETLFGLLTIATIGTTNGTVYIQKSGVLYTGQLLDDENVNLIQVIDVEITPTPTHTPSTAIEFDQCLLTPTPTPTPTSSDAVEFDQCLLTPTPTPTPTPTGRCAEFDTC